MNTAHTPGPWMLNPNNAPCIVVVGDGDSLVAILPGDWNGCTYVEADARLIAAAPELLEALLDARKQLEGYEEALNGEDYNSPRINAAIAKATGASA